MTNPHKLALTAVVPLQWRGAVRSKKTPTDAFRLATSYYLSGDKLDMNQLAEQLGIGRATLYRWVGDRELLLTEVIWSVTKALIDSIAARTMGRGVIRLDNLFGQQLELIARSSALRAFLAHEGTEGIRLLTQPGGIHDRQVQDGIEHVNIEIQAGHYRPPIDVETLIEAVVSISEHFLYADVIGGFSPQVAKARAATSLLLRETDHHTAGH